MLEIPRPFRLGDCILTRRANAGCFFGAIIMLVIGDKLGRKKGIIAGAVTMIVGVVIQVSAVKPYNHMAQFIIGRTITGIGNGMNTSTIPVSLPTSRRYWLDATQSRR